MKVGVVGTFVRDRIYPWHGTAADSVGGIFFTVSYLANLASDHSVIVPVCNLGYDFCEVVCEALSQYHNVKSDGITRHNRINTRVTLTYTGPQDRQENTTALMPPVNFDQMRILSDADAVIFNLITGEDVELAALQRFRKESGALLYLDFHTRCLAIDEHGQRYYRHPDDWQEWVRSVDILQINEKEVQTLVDQENPLTDSELRIFAREVLDLGPSICNFTLAERGSLLACRKDGVIRFSPVASVKIPEVVDIIGCGDAFEAAFVLHLLSGKSEIESARYANLVAAINTTFVGSSGISEIREKIRRFNHRQSSIAAKDLR